MGTNLFVYGWGVPLAQFALSLVNVLIIPYGVVLLARVVAYTACLL